MKIIYKGAEVIEAVIFDWAGTMIDYGCFAPVDAFIQLFVKKGIEVSAEEVRVYMGLMKRDHLRRLLATEVVSRQWLSLYGKLPDETVLEDMYRQFEVSLFERLTAYTDPIPGAVELVSHLRKNGVKIGSTTGYTQEMLGIVAAEAAKKGYRPDFMIAADEVAAGRPAPFMCYRNMLELQVYPTLACVKVGDTISDVVEGRNAGMWSVGILEGGSELGLSQHEILTIDKEQLARRKNEVKQRFMKAGAHLVVDSIRDVAGVVDLLNSKLVDYQEQSWGKLMSVSKEWEQWKPSTIQ